MDLRDKYKNKWNEVSRVNKRFNIPPSETDCFFHSRFKELRNNVNHLVRNAKFKEFNSKVNAKLKDSKKFHFNLKAFNVVNSKKNNDVKCHLDPNKLNQNFVKNNNSKVSDNHIAQMIQKVLQNSRPSSFRFKEINANDIIETVKTLKSNACGIDEISAFFIKLSIEASARIFAEIVNASLKSGYFPSRWKKARIKPIPKIADPITASDFRPISLLIAFSKIIEKIVAKQMKVYLTSNNLLDKYQSAYREKHSTITALVEITNNIYKSLDKSEITILVLLDYSKAFDCANHKLILAKLKSMGFHSTALNWISSYLFNRSQQVITEKGESSWIDLINGVPQGSILGPLLFTILVSDISNEIKHCKYHLYADDTQLYISGKLEEIVELINKLNSDLNRIAKFSTNNCLKLNEGKSVYIVIGSKQNISKFNTLHLPSITINNKSIERETTVRNLGVLFDENLSWGPEVNKCISNGYFKLKQAYRFKNFMSKKSKIILVNSYILSQFNYSSIILQNLSKTLNEKIQKFQNTCVRYILNLKKFDHISEGFIQLGFIKMDKLREIQSLTLMHKIILKKAPQYLLEKISYQGDVHGHNTRNRSNIRINHSKTNFGKNCFFNATANSYNSIVKTLKINKTLSINSFKTKLKKHFTIAT